MRLDTPDEKGETRRQRNERFGIVVPEPDPIPDEVEYLLDWFWDMSAARSYGFNGPDPIALSDIAAWSSLTGNIIRREEIEIIRRMDAAFLRAIAREQAEAAERARG